jgi:hypothetical protein
MMLRASKSLRAQPQFVDIAGFSFTPEATLYARQELQPPLLSLGDFPWPFGGPLGPSATAPTPP